MKKIFAIIILAVFLTGCYDEFRNDYPYTTVAFSTATGGLSTAGELGRTIVKDEGLKLDIGVYLAGVLENKEERSVKFSIDPSLLAGTSYELMPTNYYSLNNSNTITIPKGEYIGRLTVTLDSARFLSDPDAVSYHYAIPFRLTDTNQSVDSINASQDTKILVIKYITRAEGYYDHTGSFTTFDEAGAQLNAGTIANVIEGATISSDSIETDGIMAMNGDGYFMHLRIHPDNSVTWKKLPNPPPTSKNLVVGNPAVTVTTDYVSPWETLAAVNDGREPSNSEDRGVPWFGNWWSSNDWGWIQYNLGRYYTVNKSNVYWATDNGGILMPDENNLEYYDQASNSWLPVPNPVGYGNARDQWNTTTFDDVFTNAIRINFIGYAESVGILEWQIWGIPVPTKLEERAIYQVLPNGTNTWNPATSTFTLNYKVTYESETYYSTASTKLVWRNRIRDGVNEWRR